MHRPLRYLSILLLIFAGIGFAQSDKADSKDYPGITRMPNFYIYDYSDTQFDSVNFAVSEKGKKTERAIEGRTLKIQYVQKENTPASSMLQIIRNLQNAARAAGGQVLDDSAATTGTTPHSGSPARARKYGCSSRPAAIPTGSQLSNASLCSRKL